MEYAENPATANTTVKFHGKSEFKLLCEYILLYFLQKVWVLYRHTSMYAKEAIHREYVDNNY